MKRIAVSIIVLLQNDLKRKFESQNADRRQTLGEIVYEHRNRGQVRPRYAVVIDQR